eukprot:scaffold416_cov329-Pavlova_lutheri.AAC.21
MGGAGVGKEGQWVGWNVNAQVERRITRGPDLGWECRQGEVEKQARDRTWEACASTPKPHDATERTDAIAALTH